MFKHEYYDHAWRRGDKKKQEMAPLEFMSDEDMEYLLVGKLLKARRDVETPIKEDAPQPQRTNIFQHDALKVIKNVVSLLMVVAIEI